MSRGKSENGGLPCGGIHFPSPPRNGGKTRVSWYPTHWRAVFAIRSAAGNKCRAFAAEVTSSNTVGYSKVNLNKGYTCIAPAFFTVGQDTTELTAIEVVDGADTDSLALLDSTGNTLNKYFWFNAIEGYPAMWALDSMAENEATGVSFDQMEGFLFYSSATTAKFMHSGEVLEGDVTGVALNKGYTVLGNPYNKALPLENLIPVNAEDTDSIALLDSTGNTLSKYFWFNAVEGYPAMWALDSMAENEATGVTLDPDEAFLFYSSATTATLSVDAP